MLLEMIENDRDGQHKDGKWLAMLLEIFYVDRWTT